MSRLCIGLPVYNGERFIADALDSILAQTYRAFTLIILDNASTDRTAEICEAYATRDPRIIYRRNDRNIGAPANYNKIFSLCDAEYFKWAAHDDILRPTYLEKCMEVMERNPDVVLCHTEATLIDESGRSIRDIVSPLTRLHSPHPATRFAEFALVPHACLDIFGVIRRSALLRTPRIGNYLSSDRVLLAELALLGRIQIVPERLFLSREHPRRSVRIPIHQRVREWWNQPGDTGVCIFPYWRLMTEYFAAANRAAPTLGVKLSCYRVVFTWALRHWLHLASDTRNAVRDAFAALTTPAANQKGG